ncbi:hypothetical protein C8F04DRAFT_1270834 [Mycena alexandri]|uniref:Uncharacterized protein n=1 Tax=Mycena alexandri TaxID=1745969 RepID=A0AAD6S9V0_9AGAR|nr:hypothetical protein C8F04DRAFT_1270834 [Mycena alexandri]
MHNTTTSPSLVTSSSSPASPSTAGTVSTCIATPRHHSALPKLNLAHSSIPPTSLPPAFNTVDGGTPNEEYIGEGRTAPRSLNSVSALPLSYFMLPRIPLCPLPIPGLVPIASIVCFPHLHPALTALSPLVPHSPLAYTAACVRTVCIESRMRGTVCRKACARGLICATFPPPPRPPPLAPLIPSSSHLVAPVYPAHPSQVRTRTRPGLARALGADAVAVCVRPVCVASHTSRVWGQLRVVAHGRAEFGCARTRCCTDTGGASAPHASRVPSVPSHPVPPAPSRVP